jgi:hypothetical protein
MTKPEENEMPTTIEIPTDVAAIVGPVAVREFDNADDHYKPGLIDWARNLVGLTDDEFADVAARAIYNSALVGSFRGNWEHDHFKATACFTEANRRHVAAGHAEDCRGDTLYGMAYARVLRENGHTPSEPGVCTCRQSSGR